MSRNGNTLYNSLFSSIVSDIESYSGNDPLLPWLRGIRKMKDALPNELLKEKLPRFLEKCSMRFLTDRRYSNDLRYLRVWLQLMDLLDDPKPVLRTMEKNQIGKKKSLFYQAYALYYEKKKKFDAAEKIYHLGVQNLAEPADELQKSYEQFLQRMERHMKKRAQHQGFLLNHEKVERFSENLLRNAGQASFSCGTSQRSEQEIPINDSNHLHKAAISNDVALVSNELPRKVVVSESEVRNFLREVKLDSDENKRICSDDTIVVKFVDTAIVGKSKTEDARHHGLVEPTINTKEALNDINNMFREPLEPSVAGRRTSRKQSSTSNGSTHGFMVFTDGSLENDVGPSHQSKNTSSAQPNKCNTDQPFEIFIDCDGTSDKERVNELEIRAQKSTNHFNGSVFAKPNDHLECLKDPNPKKAAQAGFREDTVVYRFVGSTISDEPAVENVWHHGLVEPTINLKEAMNDINNMFGQPIEYARKTRQKKQDKVPHVKNNCGHFLILPDDELENPEPEGVNNCVFQKPLASGKGHLVKEDKVPDVINNDNGFLILPDVELDDQQDKPVRGSSTEKGSDLFEQTLCTKEAMDEINKLFAMPMDF